MVLLMTSAGPVAADAVGTRTGGIPLVPPDFTWPQCSACTDPMLFVAQVRWDDVNRYAEARGGEGRGLVSLFLCGKATCGYNPWEAGGGGNQAYVFPAEGLVAATVPQSGHTLRPQSCGVTYVPVHWSTYAEAYVQWPDSAGDPEPEVFGQLGGEPDWLQEEEPQLCPACGRPAEFVAQLEEGRGSSSEMFFGGGCGYVFACTACREARFLWQC